VKAPEPATTGPVWYDGEGRARTAVAILTALESTGQANQALQRRITAASGLGPTDVNAVLFLLTADVAGTTVTPKDLATQLHMSTAAASGLVDRLERAEYVPREPHATDRRGITVVLTEEGRRRAQATIGRVYQRLLDLAESLSPEEAAAVLRFLQGMADEVAELP
jgi:DNA-binding MarR family transcriptional regulator